MTTENKKLETDSKEDMIQVIRQNDTTLADFIMNLDDVDKEVLTFLAENNISYSSDIVELLSNHAKLEWYVLYHSNKTKGSHVTREILNAFKEGLPCDYVNNYINETNDAYEMEQRRLAYNANENPQKEDSTPVQESTQTKETNKDLNTDVDSKNKSYPPSKDKIKNSYNVKVIEGQLISDFITSVISVDTVTNYDDDVLNREIQEKVTDLVNINKKRNEENQELKKQIQMYQTYCNACDANAEQLKREIDKLTIDNAQKDALIQKLTDKNNKLNQKLGEIMDIQQS